ncbi:MAG: hypothetical protein ACRD40_14550 [Candidatus Acidiferrales bacterium]
MKSTLSKFDIFAGEIQKNAIWFEAVNGLEEAKIRMEQIAARTPGKYFVYCSTTRSVVATLDTHPKPTRKLKSKSHSA